MTTQSMNAERARQEKGKGNGKGRRNEDYEDYPWWPAEETAPGTYLSQRMSENEVGILPDTGAHDNLCGDQWAQAQARVRLEAGRSISQAPLDNPRMVKGVGQGSQSAEFAVTLTTGISSFRKQAEGEKEKAKQEEAMRGTAHASEDAGPASSSSPLPIRMLVALLSALPSM